MGSYTSVRSSKEAAAEFIQLVRRIRRSTRRLTLEVEENIASIREAEAFVGDATGLKIEGLDVLEIGPGQLPRQIAYFAARNRVTGVDLDVIPRGFDLVGYARLFFSNGPKRTLKTLARKALGFDRQFYREVRRQLGMKSTPTFSIVQMDASKLRFEPESYDFVYSFSVFEHLPDPLGVLSEIKRVLRPGGVALTHLHLFTSDNGSHDMRIGKEDRANLPFWAHLRPQHTAKVQTFAYLNRVRLAQWSAIFQDSMPGTTFRCERDNEPHMRELLMLRKNGELAEYGDDELLTRNLLAVWRKPLH